MKDEYIIINRTALEKKIEGLEKQKDEYSFNPNRTEDYYRYNSMIKVLKEILSQSTPLIPVLQKTWNTAYIDAMSIDEETYKPLFFEDYILNLKLDI